jgi:hypothetical protein
MIQKKAAIIILVARKNFFIKSIKNFYKNWNNQYNYPVYVHTFGKIFSDSEKIKIKNVISPFIYFFEIKPKIPNNIPKKELFYNRKYNQYVVKNFSKKRLGFLHMCYFASNITSFGKPGCLVKDLKNYDYLMRIDDDSLIKKKINFDLFDKLKKYPLGTARLNISNKKHYLLVREKLLSFLKNFFISQKIVIKNKILHDSIKRNDENLLLKIPYSLGNFDLYNMKIIKSSIFDKYIKRVNLFGGQYKYRWGDMEIINLFFYAFYKKPIYDFKFGKDIYIDKVKGAQQVYHSPFTEKYNLNLNSFYHFYLKIRKLLTYKFFYNFLKIN